MFEQHQAVVAPEQALAKEEGRHAEGAALVRVLQRGRLQLGRRRVVELGAEGLGEAEFRFVGAKIAQVLDGLARDPGANSACEAAVFVEVHALTARFPIYRGA